MRWEGLFADLEGQLVADARRELDDEVAERTRRERALVTLADRLGGALGSRVRLTLPAGARVAGDLVDLGKDWVLVRGDTTGREVLVPLMAVVTVSGLGPRSDHTRSARRFGLGYALRVLSRDRATVALTLVGGGSVVRGTIDAVGADHLDVAEHDEDVPRRRKNVTGQTTVPFAALVAVESRH
jgi:hypothetical protein